MENYIFEITNLEYWKKMGYSKNNGEDVDIEKLQNELIQKINSKILLISGDLLINFGSKYNNSNAEFLLNREEFEVDEIIFQLKGTDGDDHKLSGDVLRGVKVRSKTGELPYRWRIG